MQQPLQISFRGMPSSRALEARIRELASRLERFNGQITSCQVTVQAPHRHQQHGQMYDVRIQIRVPGKDVVIQRDNPHNHAHEDPYVAVRDAFESAMRRVEDHARRHDQRGQRREDQRELVAQAFTPATEAPAAALSEQRR